MPLAVGDTSIDKLLLLQLNKLDPIAERIADLEALVTGDRDGIQDGDAVLLQSRAPVPQVGYFVSQVRFGGRALDPIFGAHVHLHIADLQPEAAAPL